MIDIDITPIAGNLYAIQFIQIHINFMQWWSLQRITLFLVVVGSHRYVYIRMTLYT